MLEKHHDFLQGRRDTCSLTNSGRWFAWTDTHVRRGLCCSIYGVAPTASHFQVRKLLTARQVPTGAQMPVAHAATQQCKSLMRTTQRPHIETKQQPQQPSLCWAAGPATRRVFRRRSCQQVTHTNTHQVVCKPTTNRCGKRPPQTVPGSRSHDQSLS
jgi:hypothetical protein